MLQETENVPFPLIRRSSAVSTVIGVPNDDLGEEVKAVVQLAGQRPPGRLSPDLIDYCRDRLAHFKNTDVVDFVPELPRSKRRKLYKRILAMPTRQVTDLGRV